MGKGGRRLFRGMWWEFKVVVFLGLGFLNFGVYRGVLGMIYFRFFEFIELG